MENKLILRTRILRNTRVGLSKKGGQPTASQLYDVSIYFNEKVMMNPDNFSGSCFHANPYVSVDTHE